MEGLQAYRSIVEVEIRKLTATRKRIRSLLIILVLFTVMPWLTLRNFDEKFESYSWWYLDDSVLNFVVYSTVDRLCWIIIIVLIWQYFVFFSEEPRCFFRKKNSLFGRILGVKGVVFSVLGILLMVLTWISTWMFYHYWCGKEGLEIESGSGLAVVKPMTQLTIRYIFVFPLMVVLFLIFSGKWSYVFLILLLSFSALFLLDSPYQFHYNLQYSEFNREWLFHSVLTGGIIITGLIIYYRYLSKKAYVFS